VLVTGKLVANCASNWSGARLGIFNPINARRFIRASALICAASVALIGLAPPDAAPALALSDSTRESGCNLSLSIIHGKRIQSQHALNLQAHLLQRHDGRNLVHQE